MEGWTDGHPERFIFILVKFGELLCLSFLYYTGDISEWSGSSKRKKRHAMNGAGIGSYFFKLSCLKKKEKAKADHAPSCKVNL